MRIALTLLMAAGGIAFASPVSAEPASTCPPACNRIPESAWIASAAIPLNARYNWPQLSGLAASTRAPRFRFEEICASPPVAGHKYLTAGAVAARMDWPAAFPANTARPRFVRLLFQVPAATNFTAGTISAAVVTMTRDDQANRQAAKNFTV